MNLHRFFRQVLGKHTCVMETSARLNMSARILNAGSRSDLIRIGANSHVAGELFVFAHGGSIQIGDWCFIGPGTRLWSSCSLIVGNRVLISHNCNVMDSLTHPLDATSRHLQFRAILGGGHPRSIDLGEKPVLIDDDAWIGAGATILRGVTVGKAAVVGAGSVVTRNVAPYTVVAGNPARVVRHLQQVELEQ